MGDGVLAYFGYPLAHEHDAERAVRAGLAIVEAAPKLRDSRRRAAACAGGDRDRDRGRRRSLGFRGVAGARASSATRRTSPRGCKRSPSPTASSSPRARENCWATCSSLRDLGLQDLKGVAGPTRAYAALRESSQESRFEALHAGGLTALVGREEESELLLRRWAKAKAGEGQIVLLSGEAGIGKSRLTAALLEGLIDEPHVRMRYFCSPQHTDSALYPIVAQLERAVRACPRGRGEGEARQAGRAAGQIFNVFRGRRADRRDVVSAERRTLSRAGIVCPAAPSEDA